MKEHYDTVSENESYLWGLYTCRKLRHLVSSLDRLITTLESIEELLLDCGSQCSRMALIVSAFPLPLPGKKTIMKFDLLLKELSWNIDTILYILIMSDHEKLKWFVDNCRYVFESPVVGGTGPVESGTDVGEARANLLHRIKKEPVSNKINFTILWIYSFLFLILIAAALYFQKGNGFVSKIEIFFRLFTIIRLVSEIKFINKCNTYYLFLGVVINVLLRKNSGLISIRSIFIFLHATVSDIFICRFIVTLFNGEFGSILKMRAPPIILVFLLCEVTCCACVILSFDMLLNQSAICIFNFTMCFMLFIDSAICSSNFTMYFIHFIVSAMIEKNGGSSRSLPDSSEIFVYIMVALFIIKDPFRYIADYETQTRIKDGLKSTWKYFVLLLFLCGPIFPRVYDKHLFFEVKNVSIPSKEMILVWPTCYILLLRATDPLRDFLERVSRRYVPTYGETCYFDEEVLPGRLEYSSESSAIPIQCFQIDHEHLKLETRIAGDDSCAIYHYYIQGGFATFFSNVLTTEQRLREIATFISNVDVWKIFWKQKATFKRKTLLQCSQHCSHFCSNTKLLSHNLCQWRGE
jgi:hypothetical protein